MKIKIINEQPNTTKNKIYDNVRYNELLKAYIFKGNNGDLVSVGYSDVEVSPDESELFCEQIKDKHYKKEVEPIDLIEAFELNFNLGNAVKYIARCNYKGNKKEDLRKALYYLKRELYSK